VAPGSTARDARSTGWRTAPEPRRGDDNGPVEEICDITVTADDREWLVGFVRTLVAERLVACGNVTVTPVRSIYRWEGEIEEADEVSVVLHTRRALADRVIAHTEAAHPYDTPQVLVVPVVGAAEGYHRWVVESTGDETGDGE